MLRLAKLSYRLLFFISLAELHIACKIKGFLREATKRTEKLTAASVKKNKHPLFLFPRRGRYLFSRRGAEVTELGTE
jgi:hypothetical protein